MKKVMILFAVAAMFALMPKSAAAMNIENEIAALQDKQVKYDTIAFEQLPEPVRTAISETYSGYTVDKAYKGDDGTFKVNISKDAVKHELYFDSKGKLLKSEAPSGN